MKNERKLFFFTNTDVMVAVDNYGHYWTHKIMSQSALVSLEVMIKQQVVRAKLQYLGVDISLVARYNIYKTQQTKTQLTKKQQTIQNNIDALIHSSMESYYFAKIGETLIKYKEIEGYDGDTIAELSVYIDSYNEHVSKKRQINIDVLLEGR